MSKKMPKNRHRFKPCRFFGKFNPNAAQSDSAAGWCHAPDCIGEVVCNYECTAWVHRHADGSAPGSALFVKKAADKVDRLARQATVRVGYEDNLKPNRRTTVP